MEKIEHKILPVNGIKMHVAEIGEGPAVLFLHGFPELWYSWRHQMLYLSAKGYRAIAPDLRGYGESEIPPETSSYTVFHIVGDLIALLDVLDLQKVFLVGHDWGAIIAWYFCLFRPDRISALVNLSVAFSPRNPLRKPVDSLRELLGDDYYMCRFQEPGEVEKEFASIDTAKLVIGFLTTRTTCPPCFPKEIGFHQAFAQSPATLPSWLTQEDVNYYAEKLNKTGFTGGLNYYRNLDKNWELTAPFSGCKIQVPTKFMVGEQDLTYHIPGIKEYIHKGGFEKEVPNLEVVVMKGVAHFINQEKPDEISADIYDFIHKF